MLTYIYAGKSLGHAHWSSLSFLPSEAARDNRRFDARGFEQVVCERLAKNYGKSFLSLNNGAVDEAVREHEKKPV